jgi:hypothetical protein
MTAETPPAVVRPPQREGRSNTHKRGREDSVDRGLRLAVAATAGKVGEEGVAEREPDQPLAAVAVGDEAER